MSTASSRQNNLQPMVTDNTLILNENNDENTNESVSTTTTTTTNQSNITISFTPSSDENAEETIIKSFLDNSTVIKLFRDSIYSWNNLHETKQKTEEGIEKLKLDIRDKKITKSLKINIKILLPQEINDSFLKINNYIHDVNLNIVQQVLDARELYLSIINKKIETYFKTTTDDFTKYVENHLRSASSSIPSFASNFPKQKIIDKFVTNLQNQITIRLSSSIQMNEERKRKKQIEKEAMELTEEKIKTNKEKSVSTLIYNCVEENLEKNLDKLLKKRNYSQIKKNEKEKNTNTKDETKNYFKKQKNYLNNSHVDKNNMNVSSRNYVASNYNNNKNNSNSSSSTKPPSIPMSKKWHGEKKNTNQQLKGNDLFVPPKSRVVVKKKKFTSHQ